MNCPGCQRAMVEKPFEGPHATSIPVDVCHGCHGLWFDKAESLQLAPEGVLALFRELHGTERAPRTRTARELACPRCRAGLALAHDYARGNRFHSFRCPEGHGQFTPFFQFLREKGIVRTLTPGELERLRERARTVQCSNCANLIQLDSEAGCSECRTPVSVLDASGVANVLKKQTETKRRAHAAAAKVGAESAMLPPDAGSSSISQDGVDLVGMGVEVLLDSLLD
ncbi:zf-TFIIB domain-containing protein [Myxococcaceae bacterium GXIMD 01537]